MRRNIIILILFIINHSFLYSQVPQIIFKPSDGTVLTKESVDSILSENNITRKDKFECVIDNSVVSIGLDAFLGCSEMTKLTLSSNLISISQGGFLGCKNIKEVVFPESLEVLGAHAFQICSKLKTITFPVNSKLEKVEDACFQYTSITEAAFPYTLRKIGTKIFSTNTISSSTKWKQLQRLIFHSSEPPDFDNQFIDLYEYSKSKRVLIIKVPKGSKDTYKNSIQTIDNIDKYPKFIKIIES